jgi:hypothetical protein
LFAPPFFCPDHGSEGFPDDRVRIPSESGHPFRREGGHRSEVKAATHSETKAATHSDVKAATF